MGEGIKKKRKRHVTSTTCISKMNYIEHRRSGQYTHAPLDLLVQRGGYKREENTKTAAAGKNISVLTMKKRTNQLLTYIVMLMSKISVSVYNRQQHMYVKGNRCSLHKKYHPPVVKRSSYNQM